MTDTTAKFLAINGAPGSGKDTMGLVMKRETTQATIMKFSDPVKKGTHAAIGVFGYDVSLFEHCKDKPRKEFFGRTPRSCYIDFSEKYMKPLYGNDIFGKVFVMRAENTMSDSPIHRFIIPDCGFIDEVAILAQKFGAGNVLVVRLIRPGHSFANDSRSLLDPYVLQNMGVEHINFLNEGTLADLDYAAACIAGMFFRNVPAV